MIILMGFNQTIKIQAQDIHEPKPGNIDFVQNYQLYVSFLVSNHLPQNNQSQNEV